VTNKEGFSAMKGKANVIELMDFTVFLDPEKDFSKHLI
jgi:hypothetical protein